MLVFPFMLSNKAKGMYIKEKTEGASAEEEAAELQRIMQGKGEDGMPMDREEMMEILQAKMKGRKLPSFQQFMVPIKMFTMHRPNDGLMLSFGVPMSQRFQTSATYTFSNKEEAEFELQSQYMGSGS